MNLKSLIQRYPLVFYFTCTFLLSWLGAYAVAGPWWSKGNVIPRMAGLRMFPVMILGPAITGILCNAVTRKHGSPGRLRSKWPRWRVPIRWYLVTLGTAPCLILLVLTILQWSVSRAFSPHYFWWGLLFGIPAGLLEEIGWTGWATPVMLTRFGLTRTGILLGFVWGIWHLPVIDFLGAAAPHGMMLPWFALAFIAAMAAMRVVLSWLYQNTRSLFLNQLAHIISTGSLVVLGPASVSPFQETLWYGAYAAALWIFALLILLSRRGAATTGSQVPLPG